MRWGLAILSLLTSGAASAHGGGLDGNGCHMNRKTGDYHCHRSGSGRPRVNAAIETPVRSRAFPNCSAARAAGAAPVREGEPGYGRHLDRDGDGIGCE